MPVIPLVPSDSPTLISSLLRLSAHHLALAALASQALKSGILSLYLSVPVPVLTPSVVISRPFTASRPSTPLNPSPLAPQIRLCWPLCAFINYIYLLTYLHSYNKSFQPETNQYLTLKAAFANQWLTGTCRHLSTFKCQDQCSSRLISFVCRSKNALQRATNIM